MKNERHKSGKWLNCCEVPSNLPGYYTDPYTEETIQYEYSILYIIHSNSYECDIHTHKSWTFIMVVVFNVPNVV